MADYTRRSRLLTDSEIVKMYGELLDSVTVAIRANCSTHTVLRLVRAAGRPVQALGRGAKGQYRPLALTPEDIGRRYLAGESVARLAAAAGCSTPTIISHLDRLNIPRRTNTEYLRRGRKRLTPSLNQEGEGHG